MARRLFTPDNPPKSGKVKKLWDWWILHKGEPPVEIYVNHPGKWQRFAGTPNYVLETGGNTSYSIWDVEKTIKLSPDDAVSTHRGRVKLLE